MNCVQFYEYKIGTFFLSWSDVGLELSSLTLRFGDMSREIFRLNLSLTMN